MFVGFPKQASGWLGGRTATRDGRRGGVGGSGRRRLQAPVAVGQLGAAERRRRVGRGPGLAIYCCESHGPSREPINSQLPNKRDNH